MFGKKPRVIAHQLKYAGEGHYEIPLDGADFGLVFEENKETGYLYVTTSGFAEILDALHLYDRGTEEALRPEDEVFLVWSPDLEKAGFYFRGRFQAGVDFRRHEACCRSGFPTLPNTPWLRSTHEWNDKVVRGLEP